MQRPFFSSSSNVERHELLHRQFKHRRPAELRLQLHFQLHIHEIAVVGVRQDVLLIKSLFRLFDGLRVGLHFVGHLGW